MVLKSHGYEQILLSWGGMKKIRQYPDEMRIESKASTARALMMTVLNSNPGIKILSGSQGGRPKPR